MRVSWPEFVVLVLLALLAQLPGGCLGVVMVDGEGVESSKGKGGGLRGLDWLSEECCLDSCLDGCLDGTDLFWLWFPTLAGFGAVVLWSCGPVVHMYDTWPRRQGIWWLWLQNWSLCELVLHSIHMWCNWVWGHSGDLMAPTVVAWPSFLLSWAIQNSTSWLMFLTLLRRAWAGQSCWRSRSLRPAMTTW